MGVRIEAVPDSCRLKVSGDVETVLAVPYEDDDRFLVGLSDGTLLVGSYDEELHCRFDVARHGAGIVQFDRDAVIINFRVEWATVSAFDANVVEPAAPSPLPLFPDQN